MNHDVFDSHVSSLALAPRELTRQRKLPSAFILNDNIIFSIGRSILLGKSIQITQRQTLYFITMKRVSSYDRLAKTMMGPTQSRTFLKPITFRDSKSQKSLFGIIFGIVSYFLLTVFSTIFVFGVPPSSIPNMFYDIGTFYRLPISSQDVAGVAVAVAFSMLPLFLMDLCICKPIFRNNSSGRWFLLHALGNMIAAGLSLPDFYWVFEEPGQALSAARCETLSFPACTDWAPSMIIAIHIYHVLGFNLDANDIFHHALFVPTIGLVRFCYPWGTCGNLLCFFISGYFLLAAVKKGTINTMTEKRINCSINTWIRGPGITMFCTIAAMCWSSPYPGTPESDIMPFYLFFPSLFVVNFNVLIGNYYIRKAQAYSKRGMERVDLHCS
eukprot:GSMAST32.ASY1.ANO1.2372.1 assembled CDS